MKITEQKKFWNKVAKNYEKQRWKGSKVLEYDFTETKNTLLKELSSQKKNESILEIGCGVGVWTKIIGGKCKQITAIDLSEKMIEKAKKRFPKAKYYCEDFLKFNCKEKFDKIFSIRVIEYAEDKELFVKKCSELLKRNGKLTIITKDNPNLWDIININWFQKKINHNELKKVFEKNGFNKISISPVNVRTPVFQKGLNELPIIPKKNAGIVLKTFKELKNHFEKKCKTEKEKLLELLLAVSESYCISGTKKRRS